MKREQQSRAHWVAILVTAQTGEVVTAAQLLGTEEEELAEKEQVANVKIAEIEERMKKAGLKS